MNPLRSQSPRQSGFFRTVLRKSPIKRRGVDEGVRYELVSGADSIRITVVYAMRQFMNAVVYGTSVAYMNEWQFMDVMEVYELDHGSHATDSHWKFWSKAAI